MSHTAVAPAHAREGQGQDFKLEVVGSAMAGVDRVKRLSTSLGALKSLRAAIVAAREPRVVRA
jgi:acid stress-induced BolA-like protein IbaG/YrbA